MKSLSTNCSINVMGSFLAIFLTATLSLGLTSIDLAIVNVPIDSDFDLPLSPTGKVEVRLKDTVTRLKVKIERIQPLTAFNRFHRAYIVWASSPEGHFENLGELEVKGQKAELETVTRLQRFGILITAEPHFMVDRPSSNVAFRSRAPREEEIRIEEVSLEVGTFDYSHISLAPPGTIPSRVLQARMAFQIAVEEETERLANSAFRQARVAIDSMDQLLRRGMPLDVLLPYANEATRAAHRATVLARKQPAIDKLQTVTAQAEALTLKEKELISDSQRLKKLKTNAEERLAVARSQLAKSTEKMRELDVLNEGVLRRALTAEAEIIRLQNHWPQLERALIDNGARQTARGLLLTLSGEHFDPSRASLKQETREVLARFSGVLTFNLTPSIRIEGHTDASGREEKNLELSQERARSVHDLLVELGVPEGKIYSEGFGSSRPVVPNGTAESRSMNRRVEILFREP